MPTRNHQADSTRSKPLTKQEQVYREIRERVLSGRYGPGYRVVIDSIAEEFGVSALPVREAIRRLEAEGLIIYRANAGAQVAPADPGAFEDQMTVLAVLEGYATALAAPELTADDVAHLNEINNRMVSAMESMDTLTFSRLNHEFHAAIVERCPNADLRVMLSEVARRLDAIRRTVFVQIPYRGSASIAEHREVVELIRSHARADRIERAARAHKLHTVESFREWRGRTGA